MLPALSTAHCGISTMKAVTPADLTRTGRSLRLLRLAVPAFRPQPRKLPAGRFVRRLSAGGCFQASPRMSRLATDLRRIRFVILQTAGSPPVAPHPASRRRSYLQLRSQRPAPARTCTVLTKRPHGAHSCPRKRAPRANAPDAALGSRLRGCNRFPILDVTVSSVRQLNLNALGAGCLTTAGRIGGAL